VLSRMSLTSFCKRMESVVLYLRALELRKHFKIIPWKAESMPSWAYYLYKGVYSEISECKKERCCTFWWMSAAVVQAYDVLWCVASRILYTTCFMLEKILQAFRPLTLLLRVKFRGCASKGAVDFIWPAVSYNQRSVKCKYSYKTSFRGWRGWSYVPVREKKTTKLVSHGWSQVGRQEKEVQRVGDVAESSIVTKQYYDCKEKAARFQGSKR